MVKKMIISALFPFLSNPYEKLHLTEISKNINENHTTVRLWLSELENKGVLKKEFKGRQTLYSLNFQIPLTFEYITLAEKIRLLTRIEHDLILKELHNFIFQKKAKALIFGSAVKSVRDAHDIDLLVIGSKNNLIIEQLMNKLNKKIHLISVSKLETITDTLKLEILKNHILLSNSENFVRWLIWEK